MVVLHSDHNALKFEQRTTQSHFQYAHTLYCYCFFSSLISDTNYQRILTLVHNPFRPGDVHDWIVWTYETFENNFEINDKLEKIFQGAFSIGL